MLRKILIATGLILVLAGFCVGFSGSYTSNYNTATGQFQSNPNPSTIIMTSYPNSWVGTVLAIVGITVFSTANLVKSKF
jgi:hypothetical protein